MEKSNHSNVLIVGGGCAGIAVASRINSLKSDLTISIVEPSEKSYIKLLGLWSVLELTM